MLAVKYKWIRLDCKHGRSLPYKIWHAVHPLGEKTMCNQHREASPKKIGDRSAKDLYDFPALGTAKPDPEYICKNCIVKIGNT